VVEDGIYTWHKDTVFRTRYSRRRGDKLKLTCDDLNAGAMASVDHVGKLVTVSTL
jgi:hypothetical protein